MKKLLFLLMLVLTVLSFRSNTSLPDKHNPDHQKPVLLVYTWYNDPGMTDPTGTHNTVADEIARLRAMWPGNVFQSMPGIGLHEVEYGYFSPMIVAYIYSDLN